MIRNLLLASSSRVHGTGFLEHCTEAIQNHFSKSASVLFFPYALADHDQYEATVSKAFQSCELKLSSIHREEDPVHAVRQAEGIFIGGGNSFRLLKTLYEKNLLEPIRDVVNTGVPYMGSSAGTNMACPTMCTSNDMPIVEPPSLDTLNLVPFQINPHFIDADPNSTHKGETREQRLAEFHEENSTPVVGLREGSWLQIQNHLCILHGKTGAKLFQQSESPQELAPTSDLSHLLQQ